MEKVIFKFFLANRIPNLLNGIHFWTVRRNKQSLNILRDSKNFRFMPNSIGSKGRKNEKNRGIIGIVHFSIKYTLDVF